MNINQQIQIFFTFLKENRIWIEVFCLILSVAFAYQANQYARQANNVAEQASYYAQQANSIAEEANDLSHYSNELAKNANTLNDILLRMEKKSLTLEERQRRDNILLNIDREFTLGFHPAVFDKLRNKEPIQDIRNLQTFTDPFEGMWQNLCANEIWRSDIEMRYKEYLLLTCDNNQVLEAVQIGHSGFKILCQSFVPDSLVAKEPNNKNLNRCNANGI